MSDICDRPVVASMPEAKRYIRRVHLESANHIATCDKPITDCWTCGTYFQVTPGGI